MTPLLAAALWFAQQAAVPPPVAQGTANCQSPVYASDQLICSDAELWDTEQRIDALWRSSQGRASMGTWVEDQEAWFRRRALCAFHADHRACLLAADNERLSVLAAANAEPGGNAASARCTGDGPPRSLTLVRRDIQLSAYDQNGLVWVALPSRAEWTPFVEWTSGRSLSVRRLSGGALNCRLLR